jgi:hypothetical protein
MRHQEVLAMLLAFYHAAGEWDSGSTLARGGMEKPNVLSVWTLFYAASLHYTRSGI